MVCRSKTAPKRSTSQTNAAVRLPLGQTWGGWRGDRGVRGYAGPPHKSHNADQPRVWGDGTPSIAPWDHLWPRTWNGDSTRQEWGFVALDLACELLRQDVKRD